MSRDDVEKGIVPRYVEEKIISSSPVPDDRPGGRRATRRDGRPAWSAPTRPDIELGVCGEHGGDPSSIRFFHDVGLDYVSCSPFRAADRPGRGRAGVDRLSRRARPGSTEPLGSLRARRRSRVRRGRPPRPSAARGSRRSRSARRRARGAHAASVASAAWPCASTRHETSSIITGSPLVVCCM